MPSLTSTPHPLSHYIFMTTSEGSRGEMNFSVALRRRKLRHNQDKGRAETSWWYLTGGMCMEPHCRLAACGSHLFLVSRLWISTAVCHLCFIFLPVVYVTGCTYSTELNTLQFVVQCIYFMMYCPWKLMVETSVQKYVFQKYNYTWKSVNSIVWEWSHCGKTLEKVTYCTCK